MKGRKEHDEKIEARNMSLLNDKPIYLKNYYETLWDKTPYTKRDYILKLWKFLEYSKDKFDIDIKDLNSVCNIKTSMIQQYLGSINIKNASKAESYFSIKNFFKYLYNDDRIQNNPCDKVSIPKDNEVHKITYLTEEEIKTVLNNVKNGVGSEYAKERQAKWRNRDYLFIVLGIFTGMRVSSITEINIQDINFESKYITTFQKGNRQLIIKIDDDIINLINIWLQDRAVIMQGYPDNDALFISEYRKRITPVALGNLLTKYTYNIDKHITPHKLRSTCATTIIKETGNIYLASHRLGHANIETTKRYAAIDDEMEQQAMDVMGNILF